MNNKEQLTQILQQRFGFEAFRAGQYEAITSLMEHGRLLSIKPTGHGKSLLYQLPSTLLEGITVVISPLLALMRDQLLHLNQRFNIPAASLNSDQTDYENMQAMQAAHQGKIRILFVAPEQLDNLERHEFLLNLPVSLLVVDEAHCISTWGHDFRPSYRQIINMVRALEQKNPAIKILGLTATANDETEADITKQFSTDNKPITVMRNSMDRSNIQLSVYKTISHATKLASLSQLLPQLNGHGIIYCATRENTELVADYLREHGVNAAAYHAGFSSDEKRQLQHDFVLNKYQLIVATNALGMGIDKADLRYIIHFDLPGSITAYYQEVGRCGRDGKLAQGILLFDPGDKKIQQYFIDSAQPQLTDFTKIIELIKQSQEQLILTAIKRLTGMHPTRVTVVLAELLEQGFLEKILQNRAQLYRATDKQGIPDLTRYENQFIVRTRELKAMLNYGEQNVDCLMENLRSALGDKDSSSCGHCSACSNNTLSVNNNTQQIAAADDWLTNRRTKIKATRAYKISEGIAILDGRIRSPLFVNFMRQRSQTSEQAIGLSPELIQLIKKSLALLAQETRLGCVIPIPSRTWGARDAITSMIADYLKLPMHNILYWRETPKARQGELLNNDQRRYNVHNQMTVNFKQPIPTRQPILLLDDYTGSGATIREASRALSKTAGITQEIVPFTIAAVKWRLGKPGMI